MRLLKLSQASPWTGTQYCVYTASPKMLHCIKIAALINDICLGGKKSPLLTKQHLPKSTITII